MGYTVQIQRKRDKKVVLNLVKTFDRRPAAKTWEDQIKDELAEPGGLDRAIAKASKSAKPTLGFAIDMILTARKRPVGKTTIGNLRTVKKHSIAGMACEDVQSYHIVQLADDLAAEDRMPQTVGNILSSLGKVFTLGRPMWNLPLDEKAMADALVSLREVGGVARSNKRKRRPTLEELDELMARFVDRSRRSNAMPMHRLTAFAIFSTRRLGEICRLQWDDFEEDHEDGPRILVRDMKHPGEKKGNDVWCRLTPEAVAIIEAMPRVDARIFPYSSASASTNFTRSCEALAIEDLVFKDTRRDAVSRLFEMGERSTAIVRTYSGHSSLSSLENYVNIKTIGDKYEGWKWFSVVTTPFTPEAVGVLSARLRAARREKPRGREGRSSSRPSGSAPS
ncbi:MAG: site-specific integrase [Amaricoccus sp.]